MTLIQADVLLHLINNQQLPDKDTVISAICIEPVTQRMLLNAIQALLIRVREIEENAK